MIDRLHRDQAGPVRLDFAVEEVELDPATTMPLGLILNEFLRNLERDRLFSRLRRARGDPDPGRPSRPP